MLSTQQAATPRVSRHAQGIFLHHALFQRLLLWFSSLRIILLSSFSTREAFIKLRTFWQYSDFLTVFRSEISSGAAPELMQCQGKRERFSDFIAIQQSDIAFVLRPTAIPHSRFSPLCLTRETSILAPFYTNLLALFKLSWNSLLSEGDWERTQHDA